MVHGQGIMKRVTLIGPTLPFRGGIAQHTTLLHRALRSNCELETISFSRLYPKWLYPGASDVDASYEGYEEPGVCYQLDSIHPSTWMAASDRIIERRTELLILPWWTVFWSLNYWYLARKLRGKVPVLFLCHNVYDHNAKFFSSFLARKVLSKGQYFFTHSKAEKAKLAEIAPGRKSIVAPHPAYSQFPSSQKTLNRRASLELLFFGFVRPYKGLPHLIEAVSKLGDLDLHLTVAGEFWDGSESVRALIRELGISARVEIKSTYISEGEAADVFERADVVVLPYLSATSSGVIPLAYRYGRPVIASRVGGIPDVVTEGVTGFLVPPGDSDSLAASIRSFSILPRSKMNRACFEAAGEFTWAHCAKALLSIC